MNYSTITALGRSRVFFQALAAAAALAVTGGLRAAPEAVLESPALRVRVYLPDSAEGYYRGPRFDWSGMVHSVETGGHTIFGEWKAARDPAATDNVVGTAGEFGMDSPLGYDESGPGGDFFKIGVGRLIRPDNEPYRFNRNYKIVEPLPWRVDRSEHSITFSQTLPATSGWGYEYSKEIELAPDKQEFVIRYRLKNTGTKPIDTTYYCHNFVVFDGKPLAPGTRVVTAFKPDGLPTIKDIASITAAGIELVKPLPEGDSLWREFGGRTFTAADNDTAIQGPGTTVRITGDTAPEKMVFYAIGKAICIEPVIRIKLAPGEVGTWSDRYRFADGEK